MFFSVITTLVLIQGGFCLSFHSPYPVRDVVSRQQNPPAVNPAALVNFAVSQPVNFPGDAQPCTVELIHHLFANSYYSPAILDYAPPTDCGEPSTWSGLSLNWTATSNGTQYDRLSGITLQNVEIWRTSTAEPTRDGILWTSIKDVTKYLPLFSKPGRLILDLNNVIDLNAGINGEYDVRLSLTIYGPSESQPLPKSASLIIPLSTLKTDDGNAASVPPVHTNTVSLPRNAVQAFVEIQASGNAQDEFWYFNVPDEYLDKLPADTTYGKGSFREVRVTVDGQLAGVAFPYPVLFTGAIVPSVWRPIPAYGAFDLPTYNIDLTPWIPLLADGQSHTIGLEVASSEADGSINNNWYVSGNIQVVTGTSDKPTTGIITSYHTDANYTAGFAQAGNGDQTFTVTANRQLEVSAQVISGDGTVNNVVWKQSLEFSNTQGYLDKNTRQTAKQLTTGTSASTHNSKPAVSDVVDFPLDIDFFLTSDNTGSGFTAIFDHSYTRSLLPSPLLTWNNITSVQHANGTYITQPATGFSRHANGTNTNTFQYVDVNGATYNREVGAENNVITYDTETGTLAQLQFIKPDSFGPKAFVDAAELIVGRLPGGRQFPGMTKDKAII